jgi:hypothetical protein
MTDKEERQKLYIKVEDIDKNKDYTGKLFDITINGITLTDAGIANRKMIDYTTLYIMECKQSQETLDKLKKYKWEARPLFTEYRVQFNEKVFLFQKVLMVNSRNYSRIKR